jgi:hypothetical protein
MSMNPEIVAVGSSIPSVNNGFPLECKHRFRVAWNTARRTNNVRDGSALTVHLLSDVNGSLLRRREAPHRVQNFLSLLIRDFLPRYEAALNALPFIRKGSRVQEKFNTSLVAIFDGVEEDSMVYTTKPLIIRCPNTPIT